MRALVCSDSALGCVWLHVDLALCGWVRNRAAEFRALLVQGLRANYDVVKALEPQSFKHQGLHVFRSFAAVKDLLIWGLGFKLFFNSGFAFRGLRGRRVIWICSHLLNLDINSSPARLIIFFFKKKTRARWASAQL